MRFDTGQHLRMDQRMKLAPQMIQSMEILQMPQQALEERIEQELASNPTLEQVEPGADRDTLQAEREQERRDDREGEREMVVSDDDRRNGSDDFERLSNLSEQYGESWSSNTSESGESSYRRAANSGGERDAKMDAMANTAARGASLYDQLLDQWHLVELDAPTLKLGEYLIGYVDADGYLRTPLQTLLDQAPTGTTAEQIDECIELLQEALEPTGGVRAGPARVPAAADRHADLPRPRGRPVRRPQPRRRPPQGHRGQPLPRRSPRTPACPSRPSRRPCCICASSIRTPAGCWRSTTCAPSRPTRVIEYDEETDCYIAALTHGRLPALQISASYESIANDKNEDKKTREFIGTNLRNARWLLDAVRQRHATLLRVIGVVVEAQRDFFDQGPQALKPLPMTLVADQLGIHVATVSRAVSEKYLQTPRGIFPLRMFFSGGTETDQGDAMSWAAIQAKLEQIIADEDKTKPLSDDALVRRTQEGRHRDRAADRGEVSPTTQHRPGEAAQGILNLPFNLKPWPEAHRRPGSYHQKTTLSPLSPAN